MRRTESIDVMPNKLSIIEHCYVDLSEQDVEQFKSEDLLKLSKVLETLNPHLIKGDMKIIHQKLTERSLKNLDGFMDDYPKFRFDLNFI